MNDIADRDFDPHVMRTKSRPLAAGELSTREALGMFLILMVLAFGLVLMTNVLTIKLAFAGAALAASYPFFKRITHLPQLVLGIAFGWGIPMAFAAETGRIPEAAWWLLLANIVWAVIYDTLYAMVDREDDIKIGIKSTAILFGKRDLLVLRILKIIFLILLVQVGFLFEFDWPWYLGIGVAGLLFLQQQIGVKNREPAACFKAFLNNNWVGLTLFLALLIQYQVS